MGRGVVLWENAIVIMRGPRRVWAAIAIVSVSCLSLAAPAFAAQTFTVSGTGDPSTAPCSGAVCPSLRDAVAAANAEPGSTIQLGSQTYDLTQGALSLTANMTIAGNGTIQQTATDRVIATGVGTNVAINGLTITGGHLIGSSDAEGGGILSYGVLTLTDVVLSNNNAFGAAGLAGGSSDGGAGGDASGGAIATGDGTDSNSLTLISTSVVANGALGGSGGSGYPVAGGGGTASGGAIYGAANSTIVVRDSTISGNQTAGGGGGTAVAAGASPGSGASGYGAITTDGSELTIADSTVASNTTSAGSGGGIRVGPGSNLAAGGGAYGGGIVVGLQPVTLNITGSTVAGNSATGGSGGDAGNGAGSGGPGGAASGGGILAYQGAATIVNSTITGNAATVGQGGFGSPSGTPGGPDYGGGLDTAGQLTLASVTLSDNSVTGPSSEGGNVYEGAGGTVTFGDSIIAGGSATASGNNCALAGTQTDNGHNLEDTTPSQCGFSLAQSDLVGANPALMALASDGGPTQTQALGPGSAALGSGGSCTDPSQMGNPRLTVDQRGLPRPTGMCDVGAYQLQPPVGTGAPEITGTAAVGQQLSCSQGSWTGDQLSFAYEWLRDGTPITGATNVSYTVSSADSGHELTCQVTASNAKGTLSQTSAAMAVSSSGASGGSAGGGGAGGGTGGGGAGGGGAGGGGSVAPVLAAAHETNKVWVEGNALARISSARKNPVGTVFSFTLSQTATVRLTFMAPAPGRKVGKRCVAPTKRNRHRRGCTRLVSAGSLTFTGHTGLNKVAFQGRLSPSKKLKPGNFTLLITASNAAGQKSTTHTLRFTIVKG